MKKLSIITINLNNAEGLQRTIESVKIQTFDDFEYIIIDGASSDHSVSVIRKYSQIIDYWISEGDSGIYNAMNKGIVNAKGTYCLFLNSGDKLVNEFVLERVFKEGVADIIIGNLIKAYTGNTFERERGFSQNYITGYDLIINSFNHQATFIKKVLFNRFGLYDESLKIVSDWKFFIKTVLFNNVRIQYLEIDVAIYDTTGISTTNPSLSYIERKAVLSEFFNENDLENYYFLLNIISSSICLRRYQLTLFIMNALFFLNGLFYKNSINVNSFSGLPIAVQNDIAYALKIRFLYNNYLFKVLYKIIRKCTQIYDNVRINSMNRNINY